MYRETEKFCGQTAGGIVKTAHLAKNNSGAWHVWVKARDGGEYEVTVTEHGDLVLRDYGDTIVMPISGLARQKVSRLLRKADELMTVAA